MKFHSTLNKHNLFDLDHCIQRGLADDGGLFVPSSYEGLNFSECHQQDYVESCVSQLSQLDGSEKFSQMIEAALNIPLQLPQLTSGKHVLELFHGPTAAFKDFGARFLAHYFQSVKKTDLNIIVATSGDTGGAVAAAFSGMNGIRVSILFPEKGVSPLQRRQLTCWDENVQAYAVKGTFDDCQRMAKQALSSLSQKGLSVSSANSINVARLIPQMTYYVWASHQLKKKGQEKVHFVIPSGNMGNSVACIWAKQFGAPIDNITLATNANRTLFDYFSGGHYQPMPSVKTLANAMDVGDPSNFARYLQLFPKSPPAWLKCFHFDDESIRQSIKNVWKNEGYLCCPHTATAFAAAENGGPDTTVVATAHPAKFSETVQSLVSTFIPLPETLTWLDKAPQNEISLGTDVSELEDALTKRRES